MRPIDLEKVEHAIEPAVRASGYELVACEWKLEEGRNILRVMIDREGGVNLADCETLSRLLAPMLDVEDLIPDAYNLEISSPGLNRPLRKLSDFRKFIGKTLKVETTHPLANRRNFKGELQAVEGETLRIAVDGQVFSVPYADVSKARLEVDWDRVFQKGPKRSHSRSKSNRR